MKYIEKLNWLGVIVFLIIFLIAVSIGVQT
jgi:uncharacterized membrane protein YciS (DUF1049 family)